MNETLLLIRLLFWIFAAFVVFLSPRWAIFAYLVVIHLDPSGLVFWSNTSVGLENGVKVVLLPIVLLLRIRNDTIQIPMWKSLGKIWLSLVAYAAIAGIWSPYPIAAMKMVAYLLSYFVLFHVFLHAWHQKLLDLRMIVLSLWAGFAMAVLQTYFLGNPFGSIGEDYFAPRFTSFASPQSYAMSLVAFSSLLAIYGKIGYKSLANFCLVLVGLVLAGSRTYLGAFICLIAVFVIFRNRKREGKTSLVNVLKGATISLSIVMVLGVVINGLAPKNRLNEDSVLTSFSFNTPEEIGTVAYRLPIYQKALDNITVAGIREYLMGFGTSSGEDVRTSLGGLYLADTEDANRIFHDEFLRAFYEWGAIGFGLLLSFILLLFLRCWKLTTKCNSKGGLACIALFPMITFSFLVENILANPGTPGGAALVLVIACAASSQVVWQQRSPAVAGISRPNNLPLWSQPI